jgi:hypothetical protein
MPFLLMIVLIQNYHAKLGTSGDALCVTFIGIYQKVRHRSQFGIMQEKKESCFG